MSESNNKERSIADIEERFYETMIANKVFSSKNRSALSLEKLAENTESLTTEIRKANESSTKLTKSLNRLTLAAVIIAGLALVLESVKIYLNK